MYVPSGLAASRRTARYSAISIQAGDIRTAPAGTGRSPGSRAAGARRAAPPREGCSRVLPAAIAQLDQPERQEQEDTDQREPEEVHRRDSASSRTARSRGRAGVVRLTRGIRVAMAIWRASTPRGSA